MLPRRLPFLLLLPLCPWVLSLPWQPTRHVCWGFSSVCQSFVRWFDVGGVVLAALVCSSLLSLLPDLSRDFSCSPPSSSPTSARHLPPLPPCFLFSLSLPLAPPLSAHLSSSRLPGGLAPPPSCSLSPAFLRQLLLLTSRLLMASPPPPFCFYLFGVGFFHMVPGWVWVSRLLLGLPLPHLTRLICVCCSRSLSSSRLRVASL